MRTERDRAREGCGACRWAVPTEIADRVQVHAYDEQRDDARHCDLNQNDERLGVDEIVEWVGMRLCGLVAAASGCRGVA